MLRNPGSLSIYKGKITTKSGSTDIAVWDAIPICDPVCSIFLYCPHNQYPDKDFLLESFNSDFDNFDQSQCKDQCSLRARYINSVFDTLKGSLEETTPITTHTIGMFLIPLYSHLISFKIQEYALKGRVFNNRGSINPIYREMRATIKSIYDILKELGVNPKDQNNYLNGDSSYYDDLVNNGEVLESQVKLENK